MCGEVRSGCRGKLDAHRIREEEEAAKLTPEERKRMAKPRSPRYFGTSEGGKESQKVLMPKESLRTVSERPERAGGRTSAVADWQGATSPDLVVWMGQRTAH